MKKISFIIVAGLLFSSGISFVYAKEAAKSETMTITGTIIDNACAEKNKADIANFIKTHTKECALEPPCAASGYSLYHYGALVPFDAESSKKIEQFLRKKETALTVTVVIKKVNDVYSLISIKN